MYEFPNSQVQVYITNCTFISNSVSRLINDTTYDYEPVGGAICK